MNRFISIVFFCFTIGIIQAQNVLNLDSCRNMALRNNKALRVAKEKAEAAKYERKAAFTNYLPKLSAMGTYMHNTRELSLLSDDQKATLNNLGTGLVDAIPPLQILNVEQILNSVGGTITDALRTNTRNMYVGAVTLTQPVFMGGKISLSSLGWLNLYSLLQVLDTSGHGTCQLVLLPSHRAIIHISTTRR